jgi:hypothetical protein
MFRSGINRQQSHPLKTLLKISRLSDGQKPADLTSEIWHLIDSANIVRF